MSPTEPVRFVKPVRPVDFDLPVHVITGQRNLKKPLKRPRIIPTKDGRGWTYHPSDVFTVPQVTVTQSKGKIQWDDAGETIVIAANGSYGSKSTWSPHLTIIKESGLPGGPRRSRRRGARAGHYSGSYVSPHESPGRYDLMRFDRLHRTRAACHTAILFGNATKMEAYLFTFLSTELKRLYPERAATVEAQDIHRIRCAFGRMQKSQTQAQAWVKKDRAKIWIMARQCGVLAYRNNNTNNDNH